MIVAFLTATLFFQAVRPAVPCSAAPVYLAYKAVFVDLCTLTDGASRRNVLLLLGDVETSCQLLVQAD